jgi:hypothetical protein
MSISKAGLVSINRPTCTLMDLKEGDKLTLCQDEEDPECFYFFKDASHGFVVRPDKKRTSLLFTHVGMFKVICKALERSTNESIKALIAGQPTTMKNDKAQTKYWGILIRPAV